MPNRIIKESICTSDNLDGLSWFEEVLFYRLIVNCDDYGRFDGRPAIIKNRLFPLKENLTIKTVSAAINTLARAELVALYEFEGKPYLYLPTWNEHQTIRAKKSRFPAPEDGVRTSASKCMQMQADESKCSRNPIQSESNTNPNTKARGRADPPTLDEVKAYCQERKSPVDPEQFWTYFNEGGWVDAKGQPVRNWKQKLLTWEKFDQQTPAKPVKPNQVVASCDYSGRDVNGLLDALEAI